MNSIVGFLSNPSGGIWSAPLQKISMSETVAQGFELVPKM